MKKRRKIILISGAVLIAIMLINIGQYAITRWYPINIDWEKVNDPVNMGETSQDNYICYREENGIKDIPFIMGCKVILQSIEDETRQIIMEDINPFRGVSESAIIGNNVLYYRQFLGEQTDGSLKSINLKSKKGEWNEISDEREDITYGIAGEHLYYYQTHADAKERNVYCYDLKKGSQEKIVEGRLWGDLKVIDKYLYLFDQKNTELVKISIKDGTMEQWKIHMANNQEDINVVQLDNKNLAVIILNERILSLDIETGKQKTIISFSDSGVINKNIDGMDQWYEATTHDGNLYFCDKGWYPKLYKLELKSGKKELILDGIEEDPYKNKEEQDEAFSYVTFCKDYIVCIYQYKKERKIRIFDYNGEFVKELR